MARDTATLHPLQAASDVEAGPTVSTPMGFASDCRRDRAGVPLQRDRSRRPSSCQPSLSGFEALLRGKPVTTYCCAFYAGWVPDARSRRVPARRTARDGRRAGLPQRSLVPAILHPVSGFLAPQDCGRPNGERVPTSKARCGLRRLQGGWPALGAEAAMTESVCSCSFRARPAAVRRLGEAISECGLVVRRSTSWGRSARLADADEFSRRSRLAGIFDNFAQSTALRT